MCKIIFIGNYKGGVGKTTTTLNLAKYFADFDERVLTIDLDPQSSLSEIQVLRHSTL
jgi:cobyrinic acid a,c-diamide synthase